MVGFGTLLGVGGFFGNRYIDQSTREKHQFAAYIWQALRMQGIDNFETDKGQQYVSVVEDQLIPELKEHGLDIDVMREEEQRDLAQKIAECCQDKITPKTTFLGYSEITVDDLSGKISEIVQGVLQRNSLGGDGVDYQRLDDMDVPLTNFIPTVVN